MSLADVPRSTRIRLRILCVDDHEEMGRLTLLVLRRAGHEVDLVGDGEQAWQRILAVTPPYQVIVTDHQMPRLTGLQLVARLREAKFAGKIIVQSSFLTADDMSAFTALGVDAILRKPGSLKQLAPLLARRGE